MVGLEERLVETAHGPRHKTPKSASHPVSVFLSQSEVAMEEFLTAMAQHSTKTNTAQKQEEDNTNKPLNVDYIQALMNELQSLEAAHGDSVIQEVCEDLVRITLQYLDASERRHELRLELSPKLFPDQCPVCITDLPCAWDPTPAESHLKDKKRKRAQNEHTQGGSRGVIHKDETLVDTEVGLVALYDDFCREVDKHQDMWDQLDDVDAKTWVLEPFILPVRRSLCDRRIAITESTSFVFSLHPNHPRSPPSSAQWIGGDVTELRVRYEHYTNGSVTTNTAKKWSNDLFIRENLERCLGLVLPDPGKSSELNNTKADYVTECGICFTQDLSEEDNEDGKPQLPDITCENSPCARSYHQSCLYEWLQALPASRISFDRILGTCPYCSDPLSAPVQSMGLTD